MKCIPDDFGECVHSARDIRTATYKTITYLNRMNLKIVYVYAIILRAAQTHANKHIVRGTPMGTKIDRSEN